jgi:cohesin complex subunit SA-1/2
MCTCRQEKSLDAPLLTIQDLVERHTGTEVLEACAKTLETLCADNLAIYTRCDVARSTLINMLVNMLNEALDEYNYFMESVIHFSFFYFSPCISPMQFIYFQHFNF